MEEANKQGPKIDAGAITDSNLKGISGTEVTSKRNASDEASEETPTGMRLEYFDEYCKVLLANTKLNAQYKELRKERDILAQKLESIQKKSGGDTKEHHEKKPRILSETKGGSDGHKRERRTAGEISRDHKCPVENCGKGYGTETALNHHLRIKHPDYKKH